MNNVRISAQSDCCQSGWKAFVDWRKSAAIRLVAAPGALARVLRFHGLVLRLSLVGTGLLRGRARRCRRERYSC